MKRRSLSADELQRLARELLMELLERSENGAIKASGARDSTNVPREMFEGFESSLNGGRVWDFGDGAHVFGTDKKTAIAAEETRTSADYGQMEMMPMIRREGFYQEPRYGGSRTPRRVKGYRREGVPEQITTSETAKSADIRTETAEGLSEIFCRDARRYDGAFEKY